MNTTMTSAVSKEVNRSGWGLKNTNWLFWIQKQKNGSNYDTVPDIVGFSDIDIPVFNGMAIQ